MFDELGGGENREGPQLVFPDFLPGNPAHGKPLIPATKPQGQAMAGSPFWLQASNWAPRNLGKHLLSSQLGLFPEYQPGRSM